jgi:hypothetical protein
VAAVTTPAPALAAGRGADAALVTVRALRRHWPLLILLAAGAALRFEALRAVYPGIWFPDGNDYVTEAATGVLSVVRVGGYALVVAPFWHLGSAAALIVLQHVIGLGIGVVLYALLLHRGVARPLALLAVVPVLLDAYLIDIEHMIMSETIFHATIVCAIALLLWDDHPGPVAIGAAGLLLGYAAVVREVALPFIAIFAVYLLVRRVGGRRLAVFCACWALVPGAYAAAYDAQHGVLGFGQYGPRFLYAQVASLADCARMPVPADELALCPPPGVVHTPTALLWGGHALMRVLPLSANPRIRDFDLRVISSRPLGYAKMVVAQLAHYFEPGHRIGRDDYTISVWQFSTRPAHSFLSGYKGPIRPAGLEDRLRSSPNRYIGAMVSRPHVDVSASRLLHAYQRLAYTPGPLLAACLLVVAAALLLARGRGRALALDAALLAAATLTALLMASAFSVFDYRYGLLAVVLLPTAAVLGATALWRRRDPDGGLPWQP